jgi:hypothetical protein
MTTPSLLRGNQGVQRGNWLMEDEKLHPSRLTRQMDRMVDNRRKYLQNLERGYPDFTFGQDKKLAQKLFTLGHHEGQFVDPDVMEAMSMGVNPTSGGGVKKVAHRKPWQVKGSAAAKKHMKKLRSLRQKR